MGPQATGLLFPDPPSQEPGRRQESGARLPWQLGCVQGQSVMEKLVLLRGLDHAPPVGTSTTVSPQGDPDVSITLTPLLCLLFPLLPSGLPHQG